MPIWEPGWTARILQPTAGGTVARFCAWSACGKALTAGTEEKRCSKCKRRFYCGRARACQKKHWKGGHKQACEEPACCTICLEGSDDPIPIPRGCGCRGDFALAHVACMAAAATSKQPGEVHKASACVAWRGRRRAHVLGMHLHPHVAWGRPMGCACFAARAREPPA